MINNPNKRKGFAIVIVILVIMFISMFVLIFSRVTSTEARFTTMTKNLIYAKYNAEAGLNYALARLQTNTYKNRFYAPDHSVPFTNFSYQNGYFDVVIEDVKEESTNKLKFINVISKGCYKKKYYWCFQKVFINDPIPDFD